MKADKLTDDKVESPITVVSVVGRYPYRARPLNSSNIVSSVFALPNNEFRIRIDDQHNAEAWIELTVHVDLPSQD